ncbi:hypothetical protein D3C76_1089840 [compost metagenome]
MVAEEGPAPRRQPLVVDRIDDGDQPGQRQGAGEQGLAAVPGGGDEEERQAEEQAFLVDQLGGIAQQRRRQLPAEAFLDALGEQVLQHQPDPADQHDDRHDPGEAGAVAVDHDEAEDTGGEAGDGDQARITRQQGNDESDQALETGLPDKHEVGGTQHGKGR